MVVEGGPNLIISNKNGFNTTLSLGGSVYDIRISNDTAFCAVSSTGLKIVNI